jgi:DHA1 family multidrug resistance protein-like MFS transporter
MSLGRIVGPPWAGVLFDVNLSYPYSSGAVIMLVGFVMSLFWLRGDAPAQKPLVSETEPIQ